MPQSIMNRMLGFAQESKRDQTMQISFEGYTSATHTPSTSGLA
jgi:hypothetical protein